MFDAFLEYFLTIPGLFLQSALRCSIPFNPIFNLSEHHLHKERLRTHPPAPHATENDRKQNDKHEECDKADGEDDEILRPKRLSENDELACKEIEQEEGSSVDSDKWSGEKQPQQDNRHKNAPAMKPAFRLLWINPHPLALGVNGRDTVPKLLLSRQQVAGYLFHFIFDHAHNEARSSAALSPVF